MSSSTSRVARSQSGSRLIVSKSDNGVDAATTHTALEHVELTRASDDSGGALDGDGGDGDLSSASDLDAPRLEEETPRFARYLLTSCHVTATVANGENTGDSSVATAGDVVLVGGSRLEVWRVVGGGDGALELVRELSVRSARIELPEAHSNYEVRVPDVALARDGSKAAARVLFVQQADPTRVRVLQYLVLFDVEKGTPIGAAECAEEVTELGEVHMRPQAGRIAFSPSARLVAVASVSGVKIFRAGERLRPIELLNEPDANTGMRRSSLASPGPATVASPTLSTTTIGSDAAVSMRNSYSLCWRDDPRRPMLAVVSTASPACLAPHRVWRVAVNGKAGTAEVVGSFQPLHVSDKSRQSALDCQVLPLPGEDVFMFVDSFHHTSLFSWDTGAFQCQVERPHLFRRTGALAVSPDGVLAADVDHDGTVRVWKLENTEVGSLHTEFEQGGRVAFAKLPGETQIYLVHHLPDGTLSVLELLRSKRVLRSGELRWRSTPKSVSAGLVPSAPATKVVLSNSASGTHKMLCGTHLVSLRPHRTPMQVVEFDRDSTSVFATDAHVETRRVVTASHSGLNLWSLDGDLVAEFPAVPIAEAGLRIAFSPDGRFVCLTSSAPGACVAVFDVSNDRPTQVPAFGAGNTRSGSVSSDSLRWSSMCFSQDNTTLFGGGEDRHLSAVDTTMWQITEPTPVELPTVPVDMNISKDDHMLVIAGQDRRVYTHSTETLQRIARYSGAVEDLLCANFSDDDESSFVLAGCIDRNIYMWARESRVMLTKIKAGSIFAPFGVSLLVSETRTMLVAVCRPVVPGNDEDGIVSVFDEVMSLAAEEAAAHKSTTSRNLVSPALHSRSVSKDSVSSASSRSKDGGKSHDAAAAAAAAPQHRETLLVRSQEVPSGELAKQLLRFSDDGRWMALAAGTTALLVDNKRSSVVGQFEVSGCLSVDFGPGVDATGAHRFIFGGHDSLAMWRVVSNKELENVWYKDVTAAVLSISYHSKGRYVVTGDMTGAVSVLDPDTGDLIGSHQHARSVKVVQCGPGRFQDMVVSGGYDDELHFWNIKSQRVWREVHLDSAPMDVEFLTMESGLRVAVGLDSGDIHIVAVESGNIIRRLRRHHRASVECLSYNSAQGLLASGGAAGLINLWWTETGEHAQTLMGHSASVFGLAFDPSGLGEADIRLASCAADGSTMTWEPPPERSFGDWTCSSVPSTALNPRVQRLLAAEGVLVVVCERDVYVWDGWTGAPIQELEREANESVLLSPSGDLLLIGPQAWRRVGKSESRRRSQVRRPTQPGVRFVSAGRWLSEAGGDVLGTEIAGGRQVLVIRGDWRCELWRLESDGAGAALSGDDDEDDDEFKEDELEMNVSVQATLVHTFDLPPQFSSSSTRLLGIHGAESAADSPTFAVVSAQPSVVFLVSVDEPDGKKRKVPEARLRPLCTLNSGNERVCISQDGARVAVGYGSRGIDPKVIVYDVSTRSPCLHIALEQVPLSIKFSEGRCPLMLAVGFKSGHVDVHHTVTGQLLLRLSAGSYIGDLQLLEDGAAYRLLASSEDSVISQPVGEGSPFVANDVPIPREAFGVGAVDEPAVVFGAPGTNEVYVAGGNGFLLCLEATTLKVIRKVFGLWAGLSPNLVWRNGTLSLSTPVSGVHFIDDDAFTVDAALSAESLRQPGVRALSPRGNLLVVAEGANVVVHHLNADSPTAEPRSQMLAYSQVDVRKIVFSGDGSRMCVVDDKQVYIVETSQWVEVASTPLDVEVASVALNDDGSLVLIAFESEVALCTGLLAEVNRWSVSNRVLALAFLGTSQCVCVDFLQMSVYNPRSGFRVSEYDHSLGNSARRSVSISVQDELVVLVSGDMEVRSFRTRTSPTPAHFWSNLETGSADAADMLRNFPELVAMWTWQEYECALHKACRTKNLEVARLLLESPNSNVLQPSGRDGAGPSPLEVALEAKHSQMVQLLLAHVPRTPLPSREPLVHLIPELAASYPTELTQLFEALDLELVDDDDVGSGCEYARIGNDELLFEGSDSLYTRHLWVNRLRGQGVAVSEQLVNRLRSGNSHAQLLAGQVDEFVSDAEDEGEEEALMRMSTTHDGGRRKQRWSSIRRGILDLTRTRSVRVLDEGSRKGGAGQTALSPGERKVISQVVQVKATVVGIPNIAALERDGRRNVLSVLLKHNLRDAIGTGLIRQVIEYKWRAFGKVSFLRQMLAYLLFLALFTLATLKGESCPSYFDGQPQSVVKLGIDASVLAYAGFYALFEFTQLVAEGPRLYFLSMWNWLDLIYLSCIFTVVPFRLSCVSEQGTLLSIAAVIMWFKTLEYARGFRATGPFISMIISIAASVGFFLVVSLIVIFGFGHAFALLFRDQPEGSPALESDFSTGFVILKLYEVMLGNFDLEEFDVLQESQRWLAQTLFVGFTIVVSIVLLNLLIALLSDVYNKVQENVETEWLVERANIIIGLESQLRKGRRTKSSFPKWIHCLRPVRYADATEQALSTDDVVDEVRAVKKEFATWIAEVQKTQQTQMEMMTEIRRMMRKVSSRSV